MAKSPQRLTIYLYIACIAQSVIFAIAQLSCLISNHCYEIQMDSLFTGALKYKTGINCCDFYTVNCKISDHSEIACSV